MTNLLYILVISKFIFTSIHLKNFSKDYINKFINPTLCYFASLREKVHAKTQSRKVLKSTIFLLRDQINPNKNQ